MVSLGVRAQFAALLLLGWSSPLLEGRPPPTPPSKVASIPCLERVLQSPAAARSGQQLVPMLNIALLSASVGKYFLNRKKNISTECHETAMAAVQLWQRLPIVEQVDALIQAAFQDVVADAKSLEAVRNPVAVVCQKVEKRFAGDPRLSQEFRLLREWLRKKGVNKAYTKVVDMPKSNDRAKELIAEEFEDPVIGQLLAHITFVNQLKREKASSPEFHAWAKAILVLASNDRFRDPAQSLYDKTRSETADSIVSPKRKPVISNSITNVFEVEMMHNLKNNFDHDSAMKTDFEEAVRRLQVPNGILVFCRV